MSPTERKAAEWRFLQLLCHANLPPASRGQFCAKLPADVFTDVAGRIVFEEIRRMSHAGPPASAQLLREQLPGRVTARGFPDIDFQTLLTDSCDSQEDAIAAAQKTCDSLLAAAR